MATQTQGETRSVSRAQTAGTSDNTELAGFVRGVKCGDSDPDPRPTFLHPEAGELVLVLQPLVVPLLPQRHLETVLLQIFLFKYFLFEYI